MSKRYNEHIASALCECKLAVCDKVLLTKDKNSTDVMWWSSPPILEEGEWTSDTEYYGWCSDITALAVFGFIPENNTCIEIERINYEWVSLQEEKFLYQELYSDNTDDFELDD